jgi:hypothetical protein
MLKALRQTRGRRQTFSTGSWLKPVLKVPLLHRFVAQTGAKCPAYIYTHPPALSSVFFCGRCERGVLVFFLYAQEVFDEMPKSMMLLKFT